MLKSGSKTSDSGVNIPDSEVCVQYRCVAMVFVSVMHQVKEAWPVWINKLPFHIGAQRAEIRAQKLRNHINPLWGKKQTQLITQNYTMKQSAFVHGTCVPFHTDRLWCLCWPPPDLTHFLDE